MSGWPSMTTRLCTRCSKRILPTPHPRNSRILQEFAMLQDTLRYELPSGGQSLLGYIVRRMHKTEWLTPVTALIAAQDFGQALARVAMYSLAASTSFGRAFYQPAFNAVGESVSEPYPATGAAVTAQLGSRHPHPR